MIRVDEYVGIPHQKLGIAPPAWDCWGCVRYVLAVHAGIFLPVFPEELVRSTWVRVETPRPFDLAEMPGLFRVNGKTKIGRCHVGIYVAEDRILHCEEATGTVCVPVDRLRLPVLDIWRHESLA